MAQFVMDKDQLADAAIALRKALFDARVEFVNEGYPGSADLVDHALKLLDPILDLCINRELEEPFYFTAYMGRIMGDHLDFENIRPHWQYLCDLGRGGLSPLEFSKTDFVKRRLMPKQLRPAPEYVPSEKLQAQIKEDLKYKPGG